MQRRTYLNRFAIVLLLVLSSGRQLSAAWLPKEVPGLHYPRSAQFARLEGTVVVEVVLDPDGKVIDVKVISGQPILAAAAKDNARLWKFETRAGIPGDESPKLTFVFRLVGECKSQCCEDKFLYSYPNRVEIGAPLPQIQGSTAECGDIIPLGTGPLTCSQRPLFLGRLTRTEPRPAYP